MLKSKRIFSISKMRDTRTFKESARFKPELIENHNQPKNGLRNSEFRI